jgi:hypothetical protein
MNERERERGEKVSKEEINSGENLLKCGYIKDQERNGEDGPNAKTHLREIGYEM